MGNNRSNIKYVKYTNQKTKVYEAARDGAVVVLRDVLKRMSINERSTALETKIKDGDQFITPLIIAARNGNLDSVKTLLRYKADIEARGNFKFDDQVIEGCTPLWAAAASGHLDVVELLIERNADVDGRTITNSTPLRAAAYDGRLDIVRCLVENGADVNARNNFENTPLMVACYNGHINVVTYLIERDANMDLQDKQGNTVLHYAVERGHFEIANKLLALGASQVKNTQCLTPLLLASNTCRIEMVEHFINRPECTKEQMIEGLELLGATIANDSDVYDIEKAFYYIKRGMEERFEDNSHPLLKKQMEPLEVYQNRKESQTLEELSLLEGDDHAIHMEGLIIRERILGTDNKELRFPIRYRGAVFADSRNYDPCISLWEHAMEIRARRNEPITDDLEVFAELFAEMVQVNCPLRPMCIEGVFEKLVSECERLTKQTQSPLLEANSLNGELETLLYCALYLLMIYTKVQVLENKEKTDIFDLIQRFLCLDLRTHDGNTLLHLAAWYKTPIKEAKVRRVCNVPCVETMKLIIHAGSDVNAINSKGDTPLHLAVSFKPKPEKVQILKAMLELLLVIGADATHANCNSETALDIVKTNEARRILLGADATNANCNDETALDIVETNEARRILLGADATHANCNDETALDIVETNKARRILLGADATHANRNDETAFYIVETNEAHRILLGADATHANCNDETALDIVETNEARRILFEERGLDATRVEDKPVRKRKTISVATYNCERLISPESSSALYLELLCPT